MNISDNIVYWLVVIIIMTGLYVVMTNSNLIKKILGLSIFQAGVFMLYISLGKVSGGTAPIIVGGHGLGHDGATVLYSNPLPHVLILTAIVVGVATTALALAIVVRIHQSYGSLEERDINAADLARLIEERDAQRAWGDAPGRADDTTRGARS